MESVERVKRFHEAFGLLISNSPRNYAIASEYERESIQLGINTLKILEDILKSDASKTGSLALSRFRLITSELRELFQAVLEDDLEQILHEEEDLRYVLDGFVADVGLCDVVDEASERVHAANMSKMVDGEVLRDDAGKVMKGPNFQPATMKGLV